MSTQRLVDHGGDLNLEALPHWKPMRVAEHWRDVRFIQTVSGGGMNIRKYFVAFPNKSLN